MKFKLKNKMETILNATRHSKNVDYRKNNVVISNTRHTKTITIQNGSKDVVNNQFNTCFKVKNIGCSGLASLFFK